MTSSEVSSYSNSFLGSPKCVDLHLNESSIKPEDSQPEVQVVYSRAESRLESKEEKRVRMEKTLMFKMKRAASLIQRQWAMYVLRQPLKVQKAEDDFEFSSNNYAEILSRSKRHSRYEMEERVDTEENHLDCPLDDELVVETVTPAK